MSRDPIIEEFEKRSQKTVPSFRIGDTIHVHYRIIEGDGEKERIQIFKGTVIAKKGKGISETFTLYRNAYGCSMERVFLMNSPLVKKIKVARSGKVRRSKLYYLRGVSGKKAKVKETFAQLTASQEEEEEKSE